MEFFEITNRSIELKKAFLLTGARRREWENFTKHQITTILTNVANITKCGLAVGTNQLRKNYEAVQLVLETEPSGISYEEGDAIFQIPRYSGYLNYAQSANGRISVFALSPYIEGIKSRLPVREIGHFEPEEITQDLILSHVALFLDLITDWHNATPGDETIHRQPIGFLTK